MPYSSEHDPRRADSGTAADDSSEAVTLRTEETAVGGLLAVVELERGDADLGVSPSAAMYAGSAAIDVESFEEHVAEVGIGLHLFAPVESDDAGDADDWSDDAQASMVDAAQSQVRDIMTPAPTCIDSQATILQIVRLVHAKKFRHLLITDEQNELVGVVSDRDIVRCFGPGEFPDDSVLEKMRAADVMSTDVVSVGPNTSVAVCIDEMLDHGINCLPVVVGRRPVGILTTADLLRLLRKKLVN